jgi:transcriptional regulator with XRE-family HTH domain
MDESPMLTAKFKKQSLLVGSRIRALRKDRELTQADLASRIGIQQSDLCRMENGEYKVSLETLFRILSVFEMNIAEFFHEEVPGTLRERDAEILRQFHRLTPRGQEEVLEFVQFKLQFEDKLGSRKGN